MSTVKKEKKLYLCSGCKKVGVKSYKSKILEPFSCPRCKKETTLFLHSEKKNEEQQPSTLKIFNDGFDYPVRKKPTQTDIDMAVYESEFTKEFHKDLKKEVVKSLENPDILKSDNSGLFVFLTFMAGFVAALLVIKYG